MGYVDVADGNETGGPCEPYAALVIAWDLAPRELADEEGPLVRRTT
jgi:hypothetical protein